MSDRVLATTFHARSHGQTLMPFSCSVCFCFKWKKKYSYSTLHFHFGKQQLRSQETNVCSSTQLQLQLRGLLRHRHIKSSERKRRGRGTKMFWETMKVNIGLDQRQREQQQQRACQWDPGIMYIRRHFKEDVVSYVVSGAAIFDLDLPFKESLRFLCSSPPCLHLKALENLFKSLNSPLQLTGWNASGGSPCSQLWRGIHCSKRRVTEIKLSGLGLKGTMGSQLDRLSKLKTLDLSDNNIQDSIPDKLPLHVRYLNLGGNNLSGELPHSIAAMKSLSYLNVSHNFLSGQIFDFFSKLSKLSTLDLSFNKLSQGIPPSFRSLSRLSVLHLQNNQLSGPLNVIYYLPIKDLNIENNNFTGLLPPHLSTDPRFKTGGNNLSHGPSPLPPLYQAPPPYHASSPSQKAINNLSHGPSPLPPLYQAPPPYQASSPSQKAIGCLNNISDGLHANTKNESGGKKGLSDGAIVGIPLGSIILVLVVALAVTCYVWRSSKHSNESNGNTVSRGSPTSTVQMFEESIVDVERLPNSMLQRLPRRSNSGNVDKRESVGNKIKSPIGAERFSMTDLLVATNFFNQENLIGGGKVGQVYRGEFPNGKIMAVKKIECWALSANSNEAFLEAVANIAQLRHENLVELVGYSIENGQHLLVYEYYGNGNLENILHGGDDSSQTLTWNCRVKIALGLAKALQYLHEVCTPPIVHKNFKAANILLDDNLYPHLSDSGVATCTLRAERQVPTHILNSFGDSAPEHAMAGMYTTKSDIYSFGVILLELLTGRMPFDCSKPRFEQSLVRWAVPKLHDMDALAKMVDPALKGIYLAKSVSIFADIISMCLQPEPEFRPLMSDVVHILSCLVQRASNRRMSSEQVGAGSI